MEKPKILRMHPYRTPYRTKDTTDAPREKQNIIVSLKELGPAVAGVELVTHDIPQAVNQRPPRGRSGRRRWFVVLGLVIVGCLLAGDQYFLRRVLPKAAPSGPAVSVSDITTASAVISWTTERPSTSQVEFGTTPAYGSLSAFSSTPVTSHRLTLTGLSAGTAYDYATLSTYDDGHADTSANLTFTTVSMEGPPATSHITAGDITSASATITWMSDRPGTSQVAFGATADYGSLSAFNSTPVTSHSMTLTGLTPGTLYHYAVKSTNSAGLFTTLPDFTFTTSGAGGAPAISGVTASGVTPTTATITWVTDQPVTSQVEFGTTTAYGSLSAFGAALTTGHSVTLTGLTPGTNYDYAAISTNPAGPSTHSANFTFTTTSVPASTVMSGVMAAGTTTNSAVIVWNTDKPSSSQVEFGTSMFLGSLSAFNPTPVTSHSVTVTGLTPGTRYNYVALSANSTGLIGRSENFTFTTVPAPPVIRQLTATGVTGTSATIAWTTDQPSASQVQYGTTTAYGSLSSLSSTLATSHSVTLSGLIPGATYHAAAMSTNAAGMQNSSPDLKFTTFGKGLQ